MGKIRGIRFTEADEKIIIHFLKLNPSLKFSSIARIAILDFMAQPKLNLKPATIKLTKPKGQFHDRH